MRGRFADRERRLPRQQLIEHCTEGINVVRRAGRPALQLLGTQTEPCSAIAIALPRQPEARLSQTTRDAEVRDLGDALGRHENVRRLQAAMHDSRRLVRIIERRTNLQDQRRQRHRGKNPARLFQPLMLQCRAFNILHRHRGQRIVPHEIVYPDDVRVREQSGASRLLSQVIHGHRILSQDFRHELQRDRLVQ